MELAVLAGLAILGRMRHRDAPTAVEPRTHAGQYPFGPDTAVDEHRDEEQRLVAQSLARGGVPTHAAAQTFHNNMHPFFRSEGTQNTNDAVKTTRMELFTGSMDVNTSQTGTYAHKTERPPLFDVRDGMTVTTGTPVEDDDTRLRHFIPSERRHGMNADGNGNQQVGPGLGIGPDVAAAGGFHAEALMRVMPDNVNEHRVNQLEARVLSGSSAVAASQVPSAPSHQAPARLTALDARAPEPSAGTVQGATQRAHVTTTVDTKRGMEAAYGGHGAYGSGHLVTSVGSVREARDRALTLPLAHTGAAAVPAAVASPEYAAPMGHRGQPSAYAGAAVGAVLGDAYRDTRFDIAEPRAQAPLGSHGAYAQGERAPAHYTMTARETPLEHLAAPSRAGEAGRAPTSYSFGRDAVAAGAPLHGGAPVPAAATPLQNVETRALRAHVAHTPGPTNMNVLADPHDVMTAPGRTHSHAGRVGHGALPGTYGPLGCVDVTERTMPGWREPIMNPPT